MNKFTVQTTVEANDGQGNTRQLASEIEVILENMMFTLRTPLSTQTLLNLFALPGIPVDNVQLPEEAMKALGFVKSEPVEGGESWWNRNFVVAVLNVEIGVYVLLFPGGTRLGIKSTRKEIEEIFSNNSGGIIT